MRGCFGESAEDYPRLPIGPSISLKASYTSKLPKAVVLKPGYSSPLNLFQIHILGLGVELTCTGEAGYNSSTYGVKHKAEKNLKEVVTNEAELELFLVEGDCSLGHWLELPRNAILLWSSASA